MIALNSGNIALSVKKTIHIYNASILNLPYEGNCLIQKIYIKGKSKVRYIYEFPDETLLCATSSKIFRIKLIDNDTKFQIIGFIKLSKSEMPTKLISLGNMILLSLSEQKKLCNLKLFFKKNYLSDNNLNINYDKYNISNQNEEDDENEDDDDIFSNLNSNDTDVKNYFAKDLVKDDKEFILYSKGNNNNLNIDKKLLCSIFEISKKCINNGDDNKFEFITTSNHTYDLGCDRIEFYEVKKSNNELIIKRNKFIDNISCSTEADSICQLNDKFLCIGLQNFDLKGQVSGYAIIDVEKKEISQIINDNEIYCLNFIKENKLLIAAMEVRNTDENYKMIKIYNIIEKEEGNKIEFKKVCQYKSKHKDIINSIIELKAMNCAPNAQNNGFNDEKLNKRNIICATSSIDKTLRIIETQI